MQRLLPLFLGLSTIASCGRFQKSGSDDGGDEADTAQVADGSAADAGSVTFSFTAQYVKRPVDVLVIRDGQSHQDPIGRRLEAAAPVLSARLWNLGDVHVAVYDHHFRDDNPNDDQVPPTNGLPIVGGIKSDQLILKAEELSATEFGDALEERIGMAGQRGGTPMPASVLLDARSVVDPANGNFFRPDAFVAVLYISATGNPPDPFDQQDILARFAEHQSGFAISALAPDKTGCTFAGLDDVRETNPEKVPQRNLEIKMQELTGGVYGSVCTKTFALFMDDFAALGTGTAYFPVTLPAAVKPESIKIFGPGSVEVKEFRYVPDTTSLEVSTKIEPGESFQIQFVPLVPLGDAYVGTDPGDDVPGASEDELPPEQAAFVQNVQPILARSCGGCHAGRPFSVNYTSATMYKDEIARRIQLPTTDAQHMPQGGTLSDGDLQAILAWSAQ